MRQITFVPPNHIVPGTVVLERRNRLQLYPKHRDSTAHAIACGISQENLQTTISETGRKRVGRREWTDSVPQFCYWIRRTPHVHLDGTSISKNVRELTQTHIRVRVILILNQLKSFRCPSNTGVWTYELRNEAAPCHNLKLGKLRVAQRC